MKRCSLSLPSPSPGYWLPSYKLKSSWATGLHLSVLFGHVECLLVLLDHNATINCRPNGKTPLHVACEVANVDCVKILCDRGAKLNCYSLSGHTALHCCTTPSSILCAKQLVWRGEPFWLADSSIPALRLLRVSESSSLRLSSRCAHAFRRVPGL